MKQAEGQLATEEEAWAAALERRPKPLLGQAGRTGGQGPRAIHAGGGAERAGLAMSGQLPVSEVATSPGHRQGIASRATRATGTDDAIGSMRARKPE